MMRIELFSRYICSTKTVKNVQVIVKKIFICMKKLDYFKYNFGELGLFFIKRNKSP